MGRPHPVGWVLIGFFFVGGIAFFLTIPEILIGQIWIGVAVLLGALYKALGWKAGQAEKLKKEGAPGKATVLELTQTSVLVNHQPVIKLKLRVEAEGLEPFETEERVVVPLVAMASLSSGRPLPVFVDRTDGDLVIDWSAAMVAPAGPAAAAGAPPAATPPPTEEEQPIERLQTLMEMKVKQLITPEEYERERQRILSEI